MTLEEYDKAYTEEAKQIGHKIYLKQQLEKEIKDHIEKCQNLAAEKSKIAAFEDAKKKESEHVSGT